MEGLNPCAHSNPDRQANGEARKKEQRRIPKKVSEALRRASSLTGSAFLLTAMMPRLAFASSSVDITDLSSLLEMFGKMIVVVGAVIACWCGVQVFQTAKEQQGLQLDRNVWGVVGGIGMTVCGAAIAGAGSLWTY